MNPQAQAAVTGTSRCADAGCLYGLNTQNDRWQASRLAWRAGGDDKAFLDAHQPVYFTFELGDLPLVFSDVGIAVGLCWLIFRKIAVL